MPSKKRATTAGRRRTKLHVAATGPKVEKAEQPKAEKAQDAPKPAPSPSASVAVAMGAAAALHRAEAAAEKAAKDAPQTGKSDTFDDEIETEAFKRRDLIEAISDRADMKKPEARDFIDLILDEMSKALTEGKELVLPPLGKITIKRRTAQSNGDMLVAKIKLKRREDEDADKPVDEAV